MRALIVNGDDFGLTPGVNAGILDAHRSGILTSASIFANAPATEDALAIARGTQSLGVGCHLTLVDGTPLLPAARMPTLAPRGRFRDTWTSFIRDAIVGRIALHEIEDELTAQIVRIVESGLRPTHLDSHKHVHAYPPVFAIVARLARRFGIQAVRVPLETPVFGVLARCGWIAGARRQALENAALAPWAARDRRLLDAYGLPSARVFLGRAFTGLFTLDRLASLLRSVPEGWSELMTHPGYPDAALATIRTRLREQRAGEVALLTDPSISALVERYGIDLVRHDGSRGSPVACRASCPQPEPDGRSAAARPRESQGAQSTARPREGPAQHV